MTVDQLRKIWHPNTGHFRNAATWKDVDPRWPDRKIELYGPGTDSGTFDYFTEAINGRARRCRPDYAASEDDNNIINGVTRNKYALAYLGVAYYEAHKRRLRAVAVASKEGGPYMLPTPDNVLSNRYRPLSRPLFLYVKTSSMCRPEVGAFLEFYLRRSDLVRRVGYVELAAASQYEQRQKLAQALAGGD
jgi:phosphate transport system substrate-binding protein